MREEVPAGRAVVLAGGFGTRLREFARTLGHDRPKQFCAFFGKRSLLEETLHRVKALVPDWRTTVVVHTSQRRIGRRQVRAAGEADVFVQPYDRGTGPAVLYPALCGRPDDILLVTPADHAFSDDAAFRRGIREARDAVTSRVADTVLLGAPATEPRTDFGWIRQGAALGAAVRGVRAFVEKPPAPEARNLFAEGALWNTMVMVTRARALLDLFRAVRPTLVTLLQAARAVPPPLRRLALQRVYRRSAPLDLSRDVLEPQPESLAVTSWPAGCGWDDLGTPERLAARLYPQGPPA